jgi:predicted dehydrogenase
MVRVAIVGCGKIADQHADQVIHTPGCEIVGVCDREELMAQQLQERLKVPFGCTDLRDLLEHARPDVVHITTPPQTHYALGKLCLEAGCHIYVEKPFTTDLCEAEELISVAIRENRKVTVGHNAQFSHAAARMRQLVADGYLGGVPRHIEAYYCYDLSDASYARAMLGDQHHWVRALPGGLLQNTISHGLCKIAEFMTEDNLRITARGFTSSTLKSLGEKSIIDELRVIIQGETTTAYFTFSSQMKPSLHQLRLYGPKNGLIVDEQQQTVIKLNGGRHKSYLEQLVPPWNYAQQYIGNAVGNLHKFLKSDFHTNVGMRRLIGAFYKSISSKGPVPIPYDEILRTSRIMEEIFSQLSSQASSEVRDLRKCTLAEAVCDQ